MENERCIASENMKKFFEKLLDLKEFVHKQAIRKYCDSAIEEIYERLDEIIKEAE